jgi:hypothetical protein
MIAVGLLALLCWATTWAILDRQRFIRERDDALQRATQAEGEVRERLQIQESERPLFTRTRVQESERALFTRNHVPESPSTQP